MSTVDVLKMSVCYDKVEHMIVVVPISDGVHTIIVVPTSDYLIVYVGLMLYLNLIVYV